jgi:hypothetical protein
MRIDIMTNPEDDTTIESTEVEVERIDSRDIDEALDREHWIREGEMRDEYMRHIERED